jgi:hypothetical protein
MEKQSLFSRFQAWLTSPEVFGSVSKKIPGKWILIEYYVDEKEELLHFQEGDLKATNQALVLYFKNEGTFSLDSQIPLSLFDTVKSGQWSLSRNFITLADPKEFRNNLEFQFAFEKENLKLLKKDKFGKIQFFGFFRPTQPVK